MNTKLYKFPFLEEKCQFLLIYRVSNRQKQLQVHGVRKIKKMQVNTYVSMFVEELLGIVEFYFIFIVLVFSLARNLVLELNCGGLVGGS